MFIQVENVSKVYQVGKFKVNALKNINMSLERGKFCVILGPSGSGKTTFLNIIGGIDRPDEGKVIVDGEEITGYDDKA